MRIPSTDVDYFAFQGGVDQVTPPIQIPPGSLRDCSNLEVGINQGYSTLVGYERFDGRAKPSEAVYHTLPATITGSYAIGDTLTGATSGATGVICTTGLSGYFVLTKVVGTFQSAEGLEISAVQVATSTAATTTGGAATLALDAEFANLAADQYRADIAAVTGSGGILGVWLYNGTVYAFRNNAGGTAAAMYKSTASGWSLVALGRELTFTSGGTTEIAEGDTITGATSGATAVVTRVVVTSGTWGAGTAAGKVIFASQTGTFQAENLNIGASLNVATIAGNSSAITLAKDGRYEFRNFNFGGSTTTQRMYGCDGVNRAFEFDGTVFVPIDTGMAVDTPNHLHVHKSHLFLSFPGGSVQHSGTGTPYVFTIVLGAGEIGVGDHCTGFLTLPGSTADGALAIFTTNKIFVLYGNASSDWNLTSMPDEAGARAWTQQYVGQGFYLDSQGITTLATTQNFGNFQGAAISERLKNFLNDRIASASASCVVRKKNQYRLFFSTGDAVYLTYKQNKLLGMTIVTLPDPVSCICSLENTVGNEEIYFGSTDGYVYQMERGTSFDGDAISWHGHLVYHHLRSPRTLKTFKSVALEVSGSSYAEFAVSHSIGYGKAEYDAAVTSELAPELSGSAGWDAFVWDAFFWDGQALTPSEADLTGTAENISLMLSGSSDKFGPLTFNGAMIHFIPRRNMR